jgi:hypothetical protein
MRWLIYQQMLIREGGFFTARGVPDADLPPIVEEGPRGHVTESKESGGESEIEVRFTRSSNLKA